MTRLAIINFHGIGTPHAGVAPDEARYWIGTDRFRELLDRVVVSRAKGRQVMVTFDDGNRSDIEIAVPELRQRGLTACFFVLTGRCEDPRYVSASEIAALADSEMTVGLHGRDHVDWRRLPAGEFHAETVGARETLAGITGRPITAVGIPFGGYNRRVIGSLKRAGFTEIYTSDGGHASDRRRLRHRLSVRNDMPDDEVDAFMDGREPVLAKVGRAVKILLKEHVI